jgi:hypothetical protein
MSSLENRQKYQEFCQQEKEIPIFSQPWWLDTVCGEDNWSVALVEKGGQVVASMPYMFKREMLFTLISMPKFTPMMGIYIAYPKGCSYNRRLSWEKEMMQGIIMQLPKFDSFNQFFSKNIQNWLPFYWEGFHQTTRYSYTIESSSFENIQRHFSNDIKRRIKRAERLKVEVVQGGDIALFYQLNQHTFIKKGLRVPYSFEELQYLYKRLKEHDACKIYRAKASDGETLAMGFFVYDAHTVYYLMSGFRESRQELGGMALVLIKGIEFAMQTNRVFDFEGSMIEGIERYFRSFGAQQSPYFHIYKTTSKLWRMKSILERLIK